MIGLKPLATVLCLFMFLLSTGQEAEKAYKQGMKALYNEEFQKAVDFFEQAYAANPEYQDVNYRLILSHLMSGTPAEIELNDYLKYEEEADYFFHYWLGRIHYLRGNPTEGMEAWKTFLATDEYKSPQIVAETQYLMLQSENTLKRFEAGANIAVSGQITSAGSGAPLQTGTISFRPVDYTQKSYRESIEEGSYSLKLVAGSTYTILINYMGEQVLLDELIIAEDASAAITADWEVFLKEEPQLATAEDTAPVDETATKNLASTETLKSDTKAQPSTDDEQSKTNNYKTPTNGIDDISMLASKYRRRNKVIASNIYFDFGTSTLKKDSEEVLNRIYEMMKSNESIRIEIAGHTDNIGPKQANEWMSVRRAEAVVNWLAKKGISKDRLVAKGYGEEVPLASNDDEENGRELNRRIEVLRLQ
ncbi:OmpA family protein [Marinoscillum furvescens]|uniref:OmpA family protein n=1 Tax=Marinoscillum furvescens DSM 4134 TaxID=1122208 RepID=A0A3D9L063_MARFU|nr:OmpA family protein [Marinoscillum furvescens]RED96134.1 OmpA family protein [Marinoscillum furvescens DSM 4134]